MKILIISDLHANREALAILPREYDQLWVLGDLVNYGPNPVEVVEFVRARANYVVRGNHDQFLGYGDDPRCPGRFGELAAVVGEFTRTRLTEQDTAFLREQPLQMELQVGQTRFWLCHATPSDPLYGYAPPDSQRWKEECLHTPADILLVGHTHIPFMKKVRNCLIVNPGSLGLPNNRSGLACYAMWENGRISLHATAYEVEASVTKVQGMSVPEAVREGLVTLLRTGRLAGVLHGLPNPVLAEHLLLRQSEALHRIAENLQRYALKHEGRRSDLMTEEEWQAPKQALILLTGHRTVQPDTLKKRR